MKNYLEVTAADLVPSIDHVALQQRIGSSVGLLIDTAPDQMLIFIMMVDVGSLYLQLQNPRMIGLVLVTLLIVIMLGQALLLVLIMELIKAELRLVALIAMAVIIVVTVHLLIIVVRPGRLLSHPVQNQPMATSNLLLVRAIASRGRMHQVAPLQFQVALAAFRIGRADRKTLLKMQPLLRSIVDLGL